MSTILWILLALGTIVVVSALTVVLVLRALYLRVRRSRTLSTAVLRNRARFSWGPQRRVLSLRLRLRECLESGRAAIDVAVRSDGRRGELPRLFRRIENEALALDAQLRLMESETDAAELAAELPAAALRVDKVADMVHRVRASVASGLVDPSDEALATLRADVDREVAALHAGLSALRDLGESPTRSFSTSSPSSDRLQTKGASQ
ncbi:hypothetical protein WDJ51_15125 [Rathayibacter sp. YIM 133350]|uniref:hypothetical protein n=1 Tax=Rathayibacter sp. YIM 133350 TaxID=3131992 RepID=UPI00307FB471